MSVASPQIVSSDQQSFDSVPDDEPPTMNAEQQHAADTDQRPGRAADDLSEVESSSEENEGTDDDDDGGSFSYDQVYAPQQHGPLARSPPDGKQPPTGRSQRVPLSQLRSQDPRASGLSRVPSTAKPGYMNNVITSEDQGVGAVEAEHKKSEKTQPMSTIAQADPLNNGGPSPWGQHNVDRPRGNERDLPPDPTPTVEPATASHGEVYSRYPPHKELMNTNDTADEHISQQPASRAPPAQSQTQEHSVDTTGLHSQQMVYRRGGAEMFQNQVATRPSQPDQPNPEFDGFLSYARGLLDRVRELETELNEQELKWQFEAEHEKSVQESLRAQVSTLQKETDGLNTGFEQHKAKLTNCESKGLKMKSFVTGLGTDIDSLKKRFNSNRLESATMHAHIMKLEGLLNEMSSRAQQASQTQNDAMKLCRETAAELTAANLRFRHLEEQLEAKSRLIIEEKNLREQVQSQLTSVIASQEATGRELTSSKDAVLGKLGELKIGLGESPNRDEVIEMINKTFQAVQDVKSQQTPTHNDVVSSKGMLEKLAEALSGLPQQYTLGTEEMEVLKAHIENAVKDLKSDISTQERLVAQQTSDQKTIDDLRAEVRSSDARICEITSQLSTARETNTELTNQKSVLQEQVTKLESDIAASACEHEQLGNIKERLAAKETELLTTNSKADLQAQELSSLTASNADLQKQLEALEQRLQETPASPDFEEERNQLEQKRVKDVEHMREKMSDQAKIFHALHQSKAENTEKTLRSEREKLRGDIQRLKLELSSANKRIEDLTIEQNGQLELPKLLADSQKEVKELRSKVVNLEQANRSNAATLKDLESVQSQLTASQNGLLEMTKQKDSAKEEIAALQRSSQAAKSSEEKVTKQLQQERVSNRDAVQALQVALQTAKDSNIRDAKLAEDAKRTAVDEEKAKSKSEMNIMSQRLHDAEDTNKKSAEATQNALAEQQEKYEQRVAEKVDETAALRNKSTTAPGASQTYPSGSRGAPSADSTENGTAKKRRTVDRSQVERNRPTALQQSTTQRPDLSRRLAGPPARGPIVSESQSEFPPPSSFPQSSFPDMDAPGLQRPRGAVVEESQQSYPNSQMLRGMGPTVEQSQQLVLESQHFSQVRGENLRGPVVEESQQLSFLGAVVDDVARYASQGAAEVSTLGDPARFTFQEEADFESLFNDVEAQSVHNHTQVLRTSQASRMGTSQFSQQDSQNSSTRVPQSPVLQERTSRQNHPPYISRGHAGSSLHEPETRVSKKIMAPPNSSSKRTRPGTGDSSRSGGSRSQSQNRRLNKTPEPRGSSQNGAASTHGKQGLLSSSPIFADSLKSGLTGGTQRETFGRRPSSKGRPESSVKRKASSQAVRGHESQKKGRTSVATKSGASQPAPKKASQLMTTSRPSSQTGMRNTAGASSVGSRTPAPSHMRSHGNSQPTTRQTRSSKSSQRTEMGAAFSQELP